MKLQAAIPLFRIFDHTLAKQFYVDWLGFRIDWEHQFSPTAPRYLQISRDALVLHLTEHYGDGSPGAKIFTPIDDVEAFHRELSSRPNPNMNPSLERPPGTQGSWKSPIPLGTDSASTSLSLNDHNAE